MREDIKQIIKNRPLYILLQDQEYRVRLEALDYAKKMHNHNAVDELTLLVEQRKRELLG